MLENDVNQLFTEALDDHINGRIQGALSKYKGILESCPRHPETLHHLGLVYLQLGEFTKAVFLIKKSLELDPRNSNALSNLGYCFNALGKFKQALDYCERAIKIESANDGAWTNLGNAQRGLGLWSHAQNSYREALNLEPNSPKYIYNLANTYYDQKDFQRASNLFKECLAIESRIPEAHNNLSVCLIKLKEPVTALSHANSSIAIKPDYAEAWSNRGIALSDLKRHEEALASHDRSIELEPNNAQYWHNRGDALSDLKRHEEALASYERAIELKPNYAEAWRNRGIVLSDLNHHEEALASHEKAVALDPGNAETWISHGNALCNLKRDKEALVSYDKSIELQPNNSLAYWNKSLSLLRLGDFEQGWQLYEWRWKYEEFLSIKLTFGKPLWLGNEPLNGKSILLHAEQGAGDTIQFCRYATMVKRLGAKVIILVQTPLVELIKSLQSVDLILKSGDPLPNFDYHCPLLSLPLAFKTNTDLIPAEIPYLFVDSFKKIQWSDQIGLNLKKLSIGISWAGNPAHKNDHNRSVNFKLFQKILSGSFNWCSLRKDATPSEQVMLEENHVLDYSANLKDFSDTAALISQLDLIISVDSSVAHLAGALGKPVWVLLSNVPDFRWMWDRDDSPWYPTMRLFRQSAPNDWDNVLSQVTRELELFSKTQIRC